MKLLVLEIFKEEELYGTYSNATKNYGWSKIQFLKGVYHRLLFNYDFFLIIGILSNFLYYHIGSGSKNGSNRVGLASKRVQIRVQPYNVLNKHE